MKRSRWEVSYVPVPGTEWVEVVFTHAYPEQCTKAHPPIKRNLRRTHRKRTR